MICKISKIDCIPEKNVVFGNVVIENRVIPFNVNFDNEDEPAVFFSSTPPEMPHDDRVMLKSYLARESKKFLFG